MQRPANREARTLIAQAIKLAPNYAEAYAALAFAELQRSFFGDGVDLPTACAAPSRRRGGRSPSTTGANARAHASSETSSPLQSGFEAALAELLAISSAGRRLVPVPCAGHLSDRKIEESSRGERGGRSSTPALPAEGMFNLALAYYSLAATGKRRRPRRGGHEHEHGLPARCTSPRSRSSATLGARREAEEVRRLDPFFDVKLFGQRLVNPAHREKAQALRKAGL